MKRIADIMTQDYPTSNGSMSVGAALEWMREHHVDSLPVVQDGHLLTVFDLSSLTSVHPNRLLCDALQGSVVTVTPDTSLSTALDIANTNQLTILAVVENNLYVGTVSTAEIQENLGFCMDSLTDLPGLEALKEKAVGYLDQEQEIAIIILNLENFHEFTKEYGHSVGMQMIQEVTRSIQKQINEDMDFASCYGGDELVILTTRRISDAEKWAENLKKGIEEIRIQGISDSISVLTGVRGGSRNGDRTVNESTIIAEDLINLASQAAFESKPVLLQPQEDPKAYEAMISSLNARPVIVGMSLHTTGTHAEVEVTLKLGEIIHVGTSRGLSVAHSIPRLVADATLQAAALFMPQEYSFMLETVQTVNLSVGGSLIVVVVTLSGPDEIKTLTGSAMAQEDPYRNAMKAALHAVNRILTRHNQPKFSTKQDESYLFGGKAGMKLDLN